MFIINLFINRDGILNRDALWSIQSKNAICKPLSLEEYTIQEKYCDERFLRYNGGYVNKFSKYFMPSVCTYGVMNF